MTLGDLGSLATLVSAIVAAFALVVAALQLLVSARITREANALTAHRDYLRLCFEYPEYSSTEQFLAHCKLAELPDLLEERELKHVKYLWFLSELLNTAEQIVNYVASNGQWRQLVIDQIRYHHAAIKLCWIEWECHYGDALRSIVNDALEAGPYPGLEAVVDGTVNWAGYKGGYGSFIGISGPGGVGTGYGHLSRIAVRSGERVARGQLVGYSGNSGLSTGPHLHFEVYRSGATVNPRGFSFSTMAALTGSALRAFKAKVAELLSVRPGTGR